MKLEIEPGRSAIHVSELLLHAAAPDNPPQVPGRAPVVNQ